MMEKIATHQPSFIDRHRPLPQDNARPHAAQKTVKKLEELQLLCLTHPSCSQTLLQQMTTFLIFG